MTLPMDVQPEVAKALADGQPVVALESTIVTHGMPAPDNLETAMAVEAEVRLAGATPATIAVMNGRIKVGLTEAELEGLAARSGIAKLSRADIAFCLATGGSGSTTVAATMIIARLAGLEVFATGGIGGVHLGAAQDFDISADLQELAQTPVTVVAAGPKAILDIPATLEVLETLGVPVMSFGQDLLPAFWSCSSEIRAPLRVDTPADIARSHVLRGKMSIPGGQLVANPVPVESEISAETLRPIIVEAMEAARRNNIVGKDLTPFLLEKVNEMTDGRSLTANIALVRNNARLAALISAELCTLRSPDGAN